MGQNPYFCRFVMAPLVPVVLWFQWSLPQMWANFCWIRFYKCKNVSKCKYSYMYCDNDTCGSAVGHQQWLMVRAVAAAWLSPPNPDIIHQWPSINSLHSVASIIHQWPYSSWSTAWYHTWPPVKRHHNSFSLLAGVAGVLYINDPL